MRQGGQTERPATSAASDARRAVHRAASAEKKAAIFVSVKPGKQLHKGVDAKGTPPGTFRSHYKKVDVQGMHFLSHNELCSFTKRHNFGVLVSEPSRILKSFLCISNVGFS